MMEARARLLSGIPAILAVVALFALDQKYGGGLIAGLAIILLAWGAQAEFYGMAAKSGIQARAFPGFVAGIAWLWWTLGGDGPHPLHFLAGFLILLLVWEIWMGSTAEAPARLGLTLLGWVVVPFLLAYLLLIRDIPEGWAWLIFLVAVCKTGDSVAWWVGNTFGRRRMAPEVSPKKTWEGAAGSLVGSLVAGGVVASTAFAEPLPATVWVGAALLANLGGQLGDLSESLLKRGFRSKDSASLIPGLGGMFDMVDSFLLAGPLLYAFLTWADRVG